jgi:hypothetical protein
MLRRTLTRPDFATQDALHTAVKGVWLGEGLSYLRTAWRGQALVHKILNRVAMVDCTAM